MGRRLDTCLVECAHPCRRDGNPFVDVAGISTTTVYVTDRYEINLATGQTTAYYPWAGQPLPMRQGGSFYVLHSDRNGSITAVTDNAGSLVGQQRYTAYGKLTQVGNFPTDRGYTLGYWAQALLSCAQVWWIIPMHLRHFWCILEAFSGTFVAF